MELNKIYNMDCLEGMKMLDDTSIDMILADLPYGTTQNKWDSIIPLDKLWIQYERIIKENGAIVLTAQTPFDKVLGSSNLKWLKYEWIWKKPNGTGHLNAKKMPLKNHENVLVFYKKLPTYNPQLTEGKPYIAVYSTHSSNYGKQKDNVKTENDGFRYPLSVQEFKYDKEKHHPTQKPVELFEYLIKTYTNENEIILDNCIGSGTTAVACLKTNRKWIGFEISQEYVNTALKRIGKFNKKYYEQLPDEEKPAKLQLF